MASHARGRLVALAAGALLLAAVFRWPLASAGEVSDAVSSGFAVVLAVARVGGCACLLFSVVRALRAAAIPW